MPQSLPSFVCSCALIGAWLLLGSATVTAQEPTVGLQERIDRAIDGGIEFLRRNQNRDGSWSGSRFGSYKVGGTALAAYALVESGVPKSDPAIQLALRYLEGREPTMTYSAGCLLLFLAELNDKAYRKRMQRTLDLLVKWENKHKPGTWSYPQGVVDLSNTQFAALGFWAAHRRGLKVPVKTLQRMVDATMELHQEEPRRATYRVKNDRYEEEVKAKIAGFTYLPRDAKNPPRGSMTAAGLGILRIGRIIANNRLGGGRRSAMKRSERQGLGWLIKNWTVKANPGHNSQHLYFLWALERIGAFLETETIGGHRWYREGAQYLVGAQVANGGWNNQHETAYALLFLTRASRGSTTGGNRGPRIGRWNQKKGPIQFRAQGKLEISAWISKVEEPPRTLQAVVWTVDGREVKRHEVKGDPAPLKTYALSWTAPGEGTHRLRVRLEGRDADDRELSVTSEELTVKCRWDEIGWMRHIADNPAPPNLLLNRTVSAKASSQKQGQDATRLVDGFEGTYWMSVKADDEPWVELRLNKSVRARSLLISTAAANLHDRDRYARIRKIEYRLGKDPAVTVELPTSSPTVIKIPFAKKTKVKKLKIRILDSDKSRSDQVGFAEIGLSDS